MAVRPILRMGHPTLRTPAEPVSEAEWPCLPELVRDLEDTLLSADGVGLAAPQIGVGWRVVLFGFEASARYPEAEPIPRTLLINPVWRPLGEDLEEGWEGCLSLPGMRGWVPRAQHLYYAGWNLRREWIERTVSGFHARVVQHECDHLDGILYPARIRDFNRFGFVEELFPDPELRPASD
ncbi:peptide deformylase [Ferrovum sp.]|uniref:peptide deformylase n=1 Tax=Ferrovum sp. TaxID=2609467 RepID=UPI00263681CA|nr:peptide deformylase [Ferrovum sp.]